MRKWNFHAVKSQWRAMNRFPPLVCTGHHYILSPYEPHVKTRAVFLYVTYYVKQFGLLSRLKCAVLTKLALSEYTGWTEKTESLDIKPTHVVSY